MFAAREYVFQLRRAREFVDQRLIDRETQEAYATVIQSAVRMSILNRSHVEKAKEEKRARAALTIQKTAKAFLGRQKAAQLLAEVEERDTALDAQEQAVFAAMRIQKNVRGLLRRKFFLRAVRASTKIASFWRMCQAREHVAKLRLKRLEKQRLQCTHEAAEIDEEFQ
jgi:hypothetical protein